MCQWEFDIIIFFNAIALALQLSRVRLSNPYLILKSLVFASNGKLYDNSHLTQNRYFFLIASQLFFPHNLLYFFHPFHSLHLFYFSYSFYSFDRSHIMLSHFWTNGLNWVGLFPIGRFELPKHTSRSSNATASMMHRTLSISLWKGKKNKTCEVPAQGCNYLLQRWKSIDCKNNHGCNKWANFRPDNISKINYSTLVIFSYISLGLELRKVQLDRRIFK